jgi:heat-inducible transcriptional repressor
MHDLTQRQIEILKSLIEEYIETAEPVGSETLEKKHNLSASPATIRNDMVRLTDLGYLKKPHTSAGRIPTPKGMKFYVKQLMREKEMSVAEEVAVKEGLWDHRADTDKFMRELVRSLAEKTKTLAVATTDRGELYFAGYANILEMPEFYDIDVTRGLLSVLDEYDCLQSIFEKEYGDEDIHICVGEDMGPKFRDSYGFVFADFQTAKHTSGEVGVLGPVRLNYTQIVPTVRLYGNLVKEIAEGW